MKLKMPLKFAVLLMLFMSLPALAKVSGLPDFTELVEKTGAAVVNISMYVEVVGPEPLPQRGII